MSVGVVHFFLEQNGALPISVQEALHVQRVPFLVHQSSVGLRSASHPASHAASHSVSRQAFQRHVVVLVGDQPALAKRAESLRIAYPVGIIVALVSAFTKQTVESALAEGFDACWSTEMCARSLATYFHRHLEARPSDARITSRGADTYGAERAESHGTAAYAGGSGWRLEMRGWELHAPGGARVALTSTEREVILALARAPRHRLGYAALLAAMGLAAHPGCSEQEKRRLSVVLSRLRKKFQAAGIASAIRSVRGSGYELALELHVAHRSSGTLTDRYNECRAYGRK